MNQLETMIRRLIERYSKKMELGKLAELETILRVAAADVFQRREKLERIRQRRIEDGPRGPNDDVANPIPAKSDFNRSAGGGERVIRSGKEMT